MKRLLLLLTFLSLFSALSHAGGIYKQSIEADYDATYKKLYQSLEGNRFFVIDEINIGKNLAGFAKRWGEDYNRNKLDRIQVMIICNGWYANQVGNMDTDMLALCPMHVTLIAKEGVATALFSRPSTFASNSKALPVLKEAEEAVIKAIRSALK